MLQKIPTFTLPNKKVAQVRVRLAYEGFRTTPIAIIKIEQEEHVSCIGDLFYNFIYFIRTQ